MDEPQMNEPELTNYKFSCQLLYIILYILLPPFKNKLWIVDVQLKMKWSINVTITTGH